MRLACTILNFRHLLERHDLTKAIFAAIAAHLAAEGELLRGGTIMDATLIAASPSTKNKERKRDPEHGARCEAAGERHDLFAALPSRPLSWCRPTAATSIKAPSTALGPSARRQASRLLA